MGNITPHFNISTHQNVGLHDWHSKSGGLLQKPSFSIKRMKTYTDTVHLNLYENHRPNYHSIFFLQSKNHSPYSSWYVSKYTSRHILYHHGSKQNSTNNVLKSWQCWIRSAANQSRSENMVLLYYTPALHLQHRLNIQASEELCLWIWQVWWYTSAAGYILSRVVREEG